MATSDPKAPGAARCLMTHDEDEREEAAVLRQILEIHPLTLTRDELIRELTGGGSKAFPAADAVRRAVRDLAAAGLLHRPGGDELVRPTRAAVRLYDLWEG